MSKPIDMSLRGAAGRVGQLLFETVHLHRTQVQVARPRRRGNLRRNIKPLLVFSFILSILITASVNPALAFQFDVPLDQAIE